MAQYEYPQCLVGLMYALNFLGGKWKMPIITYLNSYGPCRYSDIKAAIPSISGVMLSQSLKELERAGFVIRRQYEEIPPRVEYSLSENMEGLTEPLCALARWGTAQMARDSEAREQEKE